MTVKRRFWLFIIVALVLYVSYDIIIINALSAQVCLSQPNPKAFRAEVVPYPRSIYWEDNVNSGFGRDERINLIENYLDGVRLSKIAVNGGDGIVYWYESDKNDWSVSQEILKKKGRGREYVNQVKREALSVFDRGKTFRFLSMPKVDYKVVYRSIDTNYLKQKYLRIDEVKVIDETKGILIGFNQRVVRKRYRVMPDLGLGTYFEYRAVCGDSNLYRFDELILATHSRKIGFPKNRRSLTSY